MVDFFSFALSSGGLDSSPSRSVDPSAAFGDASISSRAEDNTNEVEIELERYETDPSKMPSTTSPHFCAESRLYSDYEDNAIEVPENEDSVIPRGSDVEVSKLPEAVISSTDFASPRDGFKRKKTISLCCPVPTRMMSLNQGVRGLVQSSRLHLQHQSQHQPIRYAIAVQRKTNYSTI